ncbi:MAG TPA: hypothetical protein VF881_08565 [Polyangiaceae bacterium]
MAHNHASQTMTEEQPASQTSLVLSERRLEPWLQLDWQKFWLTVRSRDWKSLALVPAGVGGPADFTLTIAVSLARTGMIHLGVPIRVADATRVPLKHMMQLVEEIQRCTASGDLVLIALGPVAENPITVSVAQSVDSALLCILFERMAFSDAKSTVDHVGLRKFIGSAVFHPDGKAG